MLYSLKTGLMPLKHPVTLFLLLIGSILVTLIGPFGTFSVDGIARRLIYWSVVIFGSTALSLTLKSIIGHFLTSAPTWLFETAVVLAMTTVFSPLLMQWTVFVFPTAAEADLTIWYVGYYVFWIAVMVTLTRLAIVSVVPSRSITPHGDGPRIFRRLPDGFEGPILRVSVRDHKVEVAGPKGVETIRMRFSDAVAELDGLNGGVIHRSHWVAKEAVEKTRQDNGKTMLVLTNGDQVPVSRTYRPKLVDIGIL